MHERTCEWYSTACPLVSSQRGCLPSASGSPKATANPDELELYCLSLCHGSEKFGSVCLHALLPFDEPIHISYRSGTNAFTRWKKLLELRGTSVTCLGTGTKCSAATESQIARHDDIEKNGLADLQ